MWRLFFILLLNLFFSSQSVFCKDIQPVNKKRAGEIIFQKNNCAACHSINAKGGCLGPPLDDIRSHRSKDFILARIAAGAAAESKFEQLYGGKAQLMPHPRIPRSKAICVAEYLYSISLPKGGFYVVAHKIKPNQKENAEKATNELDKVSVTNGRKLFYQSGCITCHSIDGIGGHFAPDLNNVGNRRERNYIESRINNAELFIHGQPDEYQERGTIMPPSNLNEKEIKQITDFLMSLR